MDLDALLRCFADLADHRAGGDGDRPHARLPPVVLDVTTSGDTPVWLGTSLPLPLDRAAGTFPVMPRTDAVRRLAKLDALQPADHLLRLGWVVVTGRVKVGNETVGYCFPLLSQRVVLERNLTLSLTLRPIGEPQLTPLVEDPERGDALERDPQFGGGALNVPPDEITTQLIARLPRLQSWIREVVAACGLKPVTGILPPSENPLDHLSGEGLVACVGALLYAVRDSADVPTNASLRPWLTTRGVGDTAFARLYRPQRAPAPVDAGVQLDAPFPLSANQHVAAARVRNEPLTVISAPPGSGKGRTVAAIAADAVSRGWSVLLATHSQHAADALADLLDNASGPTPIRFGRAQTSDVAQRVTAEGATATQVRGAEQAVEEARARQAMLEQTIAHRLEREQRAATADRWDAILSRLSAIAPRAFGVGVDRARLLALLEMAQGKVPGRWRWLRRWQVRAAEGRLRRSAGAAPTTPLADIALAVRAMQDRQLADELAAEGGTTLTDLYRELDTTDDAALTAAGELSAIRAASEIRRRRGRTVIDSLRILLQAGRRQRRQLLHTIDGQALVSVLPLWVGTVRDANDLLPPRPGLFDLVVLDEASQIDQISAAGPLLRARRAVVVGDPHQLRHVPPVPDAAVNAVAVRHGLAPYVGQLDIPSASVLDVAAGITRVSWLDETFRAVPRLIEFSARRFYDNRLASATRTPRDELSGALEVVHVGSDAPGDSPARREVAAALEQVEQLAARGRSDIGLTTPFPELADALRTAVMERYELDDVARLGLQVSTAQTFPGDGADSVVLVLGLTPDDPVTRWWFVEDDNLFNVMITRGKRRLVVVTSLPVPASASATAVGLVEGFLAYAHSPPTRPVPTAEPSPWTASLADELRGLGIEARPNYPVGHWSLDVVAGSEGNVVAVETGVHPDGPAAHMERYRALRRTGWRVTDCYPSRWRNDASGCAAEIARTLKE